MGYLSKILKFFREKGDYDEILLDYYALSDNSKDLYYDMNLIDNVNDKYKDEIEVVDKYIDQSCLNYHFTYDEIFYKKEYEEILMRYLISIMCFRYAKDVKSEHTKRFFTFFTYEDLYKLLIGID